MMNIQKRSTGALLSALAASVAITMTAAIGLTAASEQQAPRRATSNDGAVSVPAGTPNDDPELMRIDRTNEHHG